MKALSIAALGLVAACSPERTYPDPVLPETVGWVADDDLVIMGDTATFRLMIDWGAGGLPDGLEWHTNYDLIFEHARGIPVDPIHDPVSVTHDGDAGEVLELPTADTGYFFVGPQGWIEVCQDRTDYLDCVQKPLGRAYTIASGGPAIAVDFPVDYVELVPGERRPVQPMPTANGFHDDRVTTTSHEEVSYVSEDDSIATVDADGVIEAIALGTTWIDAAAGAASGRLQVNVIAGTMGPLAGAALVTDVQVADLGNTFLDGRSPDTFAMTPDGDAAFLLDPDVASPDHDGVSYPAPLDLVRWTGSGLGYERLNAYWEATENHFFDIGGNGLEVAGWVAVRGNGIIVLDRAGDVEVGGWQRRRLPMRPDLSTGEESEDGPQDVFDPLEKEEVHTLLSDVIIGTMGAPDGVWVAYGWGASYGVSSAAVPTWYEGPCVQTIRLAHVTADEITTEEVTTRFPAPEEDCGNLVTGRTGEGYWRITVGPAEDGSDRPTLLVDSAFGSAGHVVRKWQHGDHGWLATYRGGALDSGDTLPLPVHWNVDDDESVQPLIAGDLTWVTIGPGGGGWTGNGSMITQRTGPYGNGVADSVFGPTWGRQALDGSAQLYVAGGGGFGQAGIVMVGNPPGSGFPFPRTWLYQQALIPSPHPEDPDTSGTRLSDTPATPRYQALVPLADGTRVLIQRPHPLMDGLAVSRSSGPGLPFDTEAAITGAAVPTNQTYVAWGDADRVFLAQGTGPVALSVSSDHGASFTPVATAVPSGGAALEAVSTSPGVTWLLTAAASSTVGVQLWRLDDTGGAMTATEYAAGAWPGDVALGLTADPMMARMVVTDDSVWALAWLNVASTSNHQMIARRYSFAGALLSSHAVALETRPRVDRATVTGTDVVILPGLDDTAGLRPMMRSTDAGTSWVATTSLDAISPGELFLPPLFLPDGRVAVLTTLFVGTDGEQAAVITTTDGVTWSAPRLVRPDGGHVQRPWLAALDASGDLLVHLGDAGTISGYGVDEAAYDTHFGALLNNQTGMEGLLVRVVAP